MQPSDLASLPVCDRLMYVMEHGHHVASDPTTLSVYHMVDDFYVEVRLKVDRVSLLEAVPYRWRTIRTHARVYRHHCDLGDR